MTTDEFAKRLSEVLPPPGSPVAEPVRVCFSAVRELIVAAIPPGNRRDFVLGDLGDKLARAIEPVAWDLYR